MSNQNNYFQNIMDHNKVILEICDDTNLDGSKLINSKNQVNTQIHNYQKSKQDDLAKCQLMRFLESYCKCQKRSNINVFKVGKTQNTHHLWCPLSIIDLRIIQSISNWRNNEIKKQTNINMSPEDDSIKKDTCVENYSNVSNYQNKNYNQDSPFNYANNNVLLENIKNSSSSNKKSNNLSRFSHLITPPKINFNNFPNDNQNQNLDFNKNNNLNEVRKNLNNDFEQLQNNNFLFTPQTKNYNNFNAAEEIDVLYFQADFKKQIYKEIYTNFTKVMYDININLKQYNYICIGEGVKNVILDLPSNWKPIVFDKKNSGKNAVRVYRNILNTENITVTTAYNNLPLGEIKKNNKVKKIASKAVAVDFMTSKGNQISFVHYSSDYAKSFYQKEENLEEIETGLEELNKYMQDWINNVRKNSVCIGDFNMNVGLLKQGRYLNDSSNNRMTSNDDGSMYYLGGFVSSNEITLNLQGENFKYKNKKSSDHPLMNIKIIFPSSSKNLTTTKTNSNSPNKINKNNTNPFSHLGFYIIEIPKDGNCLFEAIRRAGNISSTMSVRDLIINRLRVDYNLLPSNIGMDLQKGNGSAYIQVRSRDQYLTAMSQDGVWGGLPEIRAFSYISPIMVYEDVNTPHFFYNGLEFKVDVNINIPPETIYIAFFGNHYVGLRR